MNSVLHHHTQRSYRLALFVLLAAASLALFACSGDDNPADSTPKVPTVTTTAISSITETGATGGGTVTSTGGATVTTRGICWSTDPTPDVSDSKVASGSGAGVFTASLTGLTAGTPYYVRAYATNSVGTGYGSAVTFETSGGATTGTVTDIDGNVYETIKIGGQWWMAENLKVLHYSNGDSISQATGDGTWEVAGMGAWCNYDNDSAYVSIYGRLYNWFAAADTRNIAPTGWHVPTDDEWKTLEKSLGMSQVSADSINWRGNNEGSQLKETGSDHWYAPNTSATNERGFTALGAGFRGYDGDFNTSLKGYAYFWSTDRFPMYDTSSSYGRELSAGYTQINRGGFVKQDGFSIRCVKD
jgi:uncharacterized protein (TIGR02145 family)